MLKIEKYAKGINITEEKESDFKAKYIVEPLYRGYGNTVGNALRRVLLSSIPGAAIKGVRIEGALDEFSTLTGIKEAVTEIILNIKEVVLKAESAGEKRMTLSVHGPKVVTAGDITPDMGLEIVNPDQVICEITTDRELDMEFLVDTGEGFLASEDINKDKWPVDYIRVDAIYSPIRNVSYTVKDTRVGQAIDFDRLTLDIESDGSVDLRDALSYAVELLRYHFDPFAEIGNKMEYLRDAAEEEEVEVKEDKANDVLNAKIDELDLTVRSFNCLKKANISEVRQLAKMTMPELLKIRNLGKKSLDEIIAKMKEVGFDLTSNVHAEEDEEE